jgi:pimeloyl-ACP methyl ester carboxylesterase
MLIFPCRLRFSLLRFVALALVVAGACLFFTEQAHAAPAFGGVGTCQSYNVTDIALAEGQPAINTIYGELCNPLRGPSHAVQLLLHGGTYGHLYWDWPQQPSLYSAVRYFSMAGYSTFNIDRIGSGSSSHPPSSDISFASNAYVVHELVGRLKAGAIGGFSFRRVILVGHSLGSYIAIIEAGTYQDVDGVVLTGYLHQTNPNGIALFQSEIIPANTDPSGRFSSLDSGYLTTAPGTRGSLFYYEPGIYSDPTVIAEDEQTKETMTTGEIASAATPPDSALIKVPVLEVVGQQDAIFCGSGAVDCSSNTSVYQEESPYFSPGARLQVYVIPNTGHDLNLHLTAPQTYATIIGWSQLFLQM